MGNPYTLLSIEQTAERSKIESEFVKRAGFYYSKTGKSSNEFKKYREAYDRLTESKNFKVKLKGDTLSRDYTSERIDVVDNVLKTFNADVTSQVLTVERTRQLFNKYLRMARADLAGLDDLVEGVYVFKAKNEYEFGDTNRTIFGLPMFGHMLDTNVKESEQFYKYRRNPGESKAKQTLRDAMIIAHDPVELINYGRFQYLMANDLFWIRMDCANQMLLGPTIKWSTERDGEEKKKAIDNIIKLATDYHGSQHSSNVSDFLTVKDPFNGNGNKTRHSFKSYAYRAFIRAFIMDFAEEHLANRYYKRFYQEGFNANAFKDIRAWRKCLNPIHWMRFPLTFLSTLFDKSFVYLQYVRILINEYSNEAVERKVNGTHPERSKKDAAIILSLFVVRVALWLFTVIPTFLATVMKILRAPLSPINSIARPFAKFTANHPILVGVIASIIALAAVTTLLVVTGYFPLAIALPHAEVVSAYFIAGFNALVNFTKAHFIVDSIILLFASLAYMYRNEIQDYYSYEFRKAVGSEAEDLVNVEMSHEMFATGKTECPQTLEETNTWTYAFKSWFGFGGKNYDSSFLEQFKSNEHVFPNDHNPNIDYTGDYTTTTTASI